MPAGHSVMMVADLARPVAVPEAPRGLVASSFDPAAAGELRLAHNPAFGDDPDRTPMGPDFWELFLGLAREAGYATASLSVDTANPTGALGVYERAGFRHLYQQDSYELVEPPLP